MPKIYSLCLDAFPETDELCKYLLNHQFKRSHLVCSGAFTCATMTGMISGSLGTEIIPDGIGYNTTYTKRFLTWRQQTSDNRCLIDQLTSHNQMVIIHNHIPWMSHNICGQQLSDQEKNRHYREHVVCDGDGDGDVNVYPFGVIKDVTDQMKFTSTHPDLTLNTFLDWNDCSKKQQFYSNESQYINYIQNYKFSGLFWNDLCQWHEAVYYGKAIKNVKEMALIDSVNWLKNWDFDEPDSVFFIYADHSHRVNSHLDPSAYLTWIYFKDNRSNPVDLDPIISSCDFYSLAKDILIPQNTDNVKMSQWTKRMGKDSPYLDSRIYACEDGRQTFSIKDKALTFLRASLFNTLWISVAKIKENGEIPAGIYAMMTTLDNKHTYTVYRFTDLDQECLESFSILCKNSLDPPHKSDQLIYVLNQEIMNKIKQLYQLIFDS